MAIAESNTQWKRGFWAVWATQFQESLSDNAYRFVVISFVADLAHEGCREENSGKQCQIFRPQAAIHSFGFIGTLALPLITGTGVVFHPNPFDARTIGALVAQYAVTFLLATPTFLQSYIRRCDPAQLGSMKLVPVGAEKLQERTATAFEDKFGIRPLEAYGCTECSPAVTVNTRDFRAAGFRQVGGKRGKIGHALPGISIRIVDPETFERLPVGANPA